MQLWGLLPNRTQGLRPHRIFEGGTKKQSRREAQSLSTPEVVIWMRGGGSEGAKNPRDPLRVREAHKTINPEG